MAHEPIDISPFADLFASDSDLLVTSATRDQHLAGYHSAIVDGIDYHQWRDTSVSVVPN